MVVAIVATSSLVSDDNRTGDMTAWCNTDTALLDAATSCHLLPPLLAKLPPQVSQVFISWLRGSAALLTHLRAAQLTDYAKLRMFICSGCVSCLEARRLTISYYFSKVGSYNAGRYLDNSAQSLNRTAQVPESDILKHPEPETTEISRLQTLK